MLLQRKTPHPAVRLVRHDTGWTTKLLREEQFPEAVLNHAIAIETARCRPRQRVLEALRSAVAEGQATGAIVV